MKKKYYKSYSNMLDYFGYLVLLIFVIFMVQMINDGPFIFHSGTKHFVNISDIEFDIKSLNIKKGDTVVWTNYDQIRHTVINDDGKINNSDVLYQYDKYSHTFQREGTFTFYSSLYENMDKMIVSVGESLKGKNFYGEIGNNLAKLVRDFFGSIIFYIRFGIKKLFKK